MPIGLVNDDDFDLELSKYTNVNSNKQQVEVIININEEKGRRPGDVAVPDSIQKIIGETSITEGRKEALKLASFFDVSESSVSAYTNGAASTASYNNPKKELKSHVDKARMKVIGKARKTLLNSLNYITEEKLAIEKPSTLSAVARDMSVIIKNMEPSKEVSSDDSDTSKTPFVIYAPQFRDERSFEVINVQNEPT